MRYFYFKDPDFIDWIAWMDEGVLDENGWVICHNILFHDFNWGGYKPDGRIGKIEFKNKKELIKFLFLKHPEKFT